MSKEKSQPSGSASQQAVTLDIPSTFNRALADYTAVMDHEWVEYLLTLTDDLTDTRVLHINSTANGGGVAERLSSLIPLFNDLGVPSEWRVMDAGESFFRVTKNLHNGLQGQGIPVSDEMKTTYRQVTTRNAMVITDEYDIIVLHDPQPLGMIDVLADRFPDTRFVWRCHIDLTSATQAHLTFIRNYVEEVDHAIFSHSVYGRRINGTPSTIIHPSIDPISEKNRLLVQSEVARERERLSATGVDSNSPVVTQISRFDPWKDQLGVVEVYRRVKEEWPDLQLVLVGGMADDDPEGAETYNRVAEATTADLDIHLLTNQPDTTINFLQRHADVVLQKSLREGFGLVVAEALWKRTPVIGSNVGGIPIQIDDGENGYLQDPRDIVTFAEMTERLLTDKGLQENLGQQGRVTVREQFLLPRNLLDYLELFTDIR